MVACEGALASFYRPELVPILSCLGGKGRVRRGVESEANLVARGFVGDVFGCAVDVIHGVGLCGDVVFGGAGGSVVSDCIGHLEI